MEKQVAGFDIVFKDFVSAKDYMELERFVFSMQSEENMSKIVDLQKRYLEILIKEIKKDGKNITFEDFIGSISAKDFKNLLKELIELLEDGSVKQVLLTPFLADEQIAKDIKKK